MPGNGAEEGDKSHAADCPQPSTSASLDRRLLLDLYDRVRTVDFEPPILRRVRPFGEMDLNDGLLLLLAIELCKALAKLICLDADD
jgi:hypothetical protein